MHAMPAKIQLQGKICSSDMFLTTKYIAWIVSVLPAKLDPHTLEIMLMKPNTNNDVYILD